MTPATGQILRRVGLLVETICLLGLLSLARSNTPPGKLAGISVQHYCTVGLVAGFVLWIVGTATIYWPRKASPKESGK